jgi:hypothetical protein
VPNILRDWSINADASQAILSLVLKRLVSVSITFHMRRMYRPISNMQKMLLNSLIADRSIFMMHLWLEQTFIFSIKNHSLKAP